MADPSSRPPLDLLGTATEAAGVLAGQERPAAARAKVPLPEARGEGGREGTEARTERRPAGRATASGSGPGNDSRPGRPTA